MKKSKGSAIIFIVLLVVTVLAGCGVKYFVEKNAKIKTEENKMGFDSVTRTKVDDVIFTAKGIIPDDYKLTSAAINTKDKRLAKIMPADSEVIKSYDISIANNKGKEYQPKKEGHTLTMLVEDPEFANYEDIIVYHTPDKGMPEAVDVSRVRKDAVVLNVDSFSEYTFVGSPDKGEEKVTFLKKGTQVNVALKKLVRKNYTYSSHDTKVYSIEWSDGPFTSTTELQESGEKVYAKYVEGTIYLYTEANKIYFNADSSMMFAYFENLNEISLYDSDGTRSIDTSLMTDASMMFIGDSNLETLGKDRNGIEVGTAYWDMSNVTDISYMFCGCSYLIFDCSYWNVSKVVNMSYFACDCSSLLTVDISQWDLENVTDMTYMFSGCENMLEIVLEHTSDKTNTAAKVKNFAYFLDGCNSLVSLDFTGWNTSAGTDFEKMLNCANVTKIVSPSIIGTSNIEVPYYEWYIDDNDDGESDDNVRYKKLNVATKSHIYKLCQYDYSVFVNGVTFSRTLKGSTYDFANSTIKKIEWTDTNFSTEPDVKRVDSEGAPIYAKQTDDTVYLYTEVPVVYLNSNSTQMFYYMTGLTSTDSVSFLFDKKVDLSRVERLSSAFSNCTNLNTLNLTKLDISNVSDISSMFYMCSKLQTLNLAGWDTSNVKKASRLFSGCTKLESLDMTGWVTSNIQEINNMFENCQKLTALDLSDWDVSNVVEMNYVFYGCSGLVSLDLSDWNTSKVTSLISTFTACENLTSLNISGWKTFNVTDMRSTFRNCKSIVTIDLSEWDVKNVKDFSDAFGYCDELKSINAEKWNTSNVTSMANMFTSCGIQSWEFLKNWDVSNVRDMSNLFSYCYVESMDLSRWDTSNVTNMNGIFRYIMFHRNKEKFDEIGISDWNTAKVTDMRYAFQSANFNILDLTKWDISNVNYMTRIFSASDIKELNISTWIIKESAETSSMLEGCDKLEIIKAPKNILHNIKLPVYGYWYLDANKNLNIDDDEKAKIYSSLIQNSDIPLIYIRSMNYYYDESCEYTILKPGEFFYEKYWKNKTSGTTFKWTDKDLSKYEDSYIISIEGQPVYARQWTWASDVELYTKAKVIYFNEDCSYMFAKARNDSFLTDKRLNTSLIQNLSYGFYLSSIDQEFISKMNMPELRDITNAFENYQCSKLDLSAWNVSKVKSLDEVFEKSSLEDINLAGWNTSNVTSMDSTFFNCSKLKTLNVTGWDTSNVISAQNTFKNCELLEYLDVSDWRLPNVQNTGYMFYWCLNLTNLDVSEWDMSSATNCQYMFYTNKNLESLDVSKWHIAQRNPDLKYMFAYCSKLTMLDLTGWDMSADDIRNSVSMFSECNNLVKIKAPHKTGTGTSYLFPGDKWWLDDNEDGIYDTSIGYTSWLKGESKSRIYIRGEAESVKFIIIDGEKEEKVEEQVFLKSDNSAKAIEPSKYKYKKIGYKLDGWYVDRTCTQKYDFSQAVSSSFNLYAKWQRPAYTITFDPNGGVLVGADSKVVYYGSTYGALPTAIRDGYFFGGWRTPSGEIINSKNIVLIEGDTTLTAYWSTTKIMFTVTFEPNGGTAVDPVTVGYGETITKPYTQKGGYKFDKWYIDAALTTPWDFDNDRVDCDMTLYAGWIRDSIKVTFLTSGGKFSDNTTNKVVEIPAGSKVTKPEDPTKEKNTFNGWSMDGEHAFDFETILNDDTTLYAMWENAVFIVTMDANTGKFADNTDIHTQEVAKGNALGTVESPTKSGYKFKGWWYAGEYYDTNTPVTHNLTIKAIWEPTESSDGDELHVWYKGHEWKKKKGN